MCRIFAFLGSSLTMSVDPGSPSVNWCQSLLRHVGISRDGCDVPQQGAFLSWLDPKSISKNRSCVSALDFWTKLLLLLLQRRKKKPVREPKLSSCLLQATDTLVLRLVTCEMNAVCLTQIQHRQSEVKTQELVSSLWSLGKKKCQLRKMREIMF